MSAFNRFKRLLTIIGALAPLLGSTNQAMKTTQPSFSSVFISDSRIDALKKAIAEEQNPTYPAFMTCRLYADQQYDFKSASGHSLQQAYETLAGWTRRPDTFPYWKKDPEKLLGVNYFSYFEILNTHWTNANAAELLLRSRPLTAKHSAPFLTFTHGTSLETQKRDGL